MRLEGSGASFVRVIIGRLSDLSGESGLGAQRIAANNPVGRVRVIRSAEESGGDGGQSVVSSQFLVVGHAEALGEQFGVTSGLHPRQSHFLALLVDHNKERMGSDRFLVHDQIVAVVVEGEGRDVLHVHVAVAPEVAVLDVGSHLEG